MLNCRPTFSIIYELQYFCTPHGTVIIHVELQILGSLNLITNANINVLIKHAPKKAIRKVGSNGPGNKQLFWTFFHSLIYWFATFSNLSMIANAIFILFNETCTRKKLQGCSIGPGSKRI